MHHPDNRAALSKHAGGTSPRYAGRGRPPIPGSAQEPSCNLTPGLSPPCSHGGMFTGSSQAPHAHPPPPGVTEQPAPAPLPEGDEGDVPRHQVRASHMNVCFPSDQRQAPEGQGYSLSGCLAVPTNPGGAAQLPFNRTGPRKLTRATTVHVMMLISLHT